MVISLERDADLLKAQLMPLPLTVSCFSESRLILPFWYRPTLVVLEKGPFNVCVCVCIFICLERGADLHMAQWIPLPLAVYCFSQIQIGFTFLVLAYPSSPGQRAVKRVCVCC